MREKRNGSQGVEEKQEAAQALFLSVILYLNWYFFIL